MLWFGTLVYGFAFVLALPMSMAIDETRIGALSLRMVSSTRRPRPSRTG